MQATLAQGNNGKFSTAVEASPNKIQIDIWLNEGKSNLWISRELMARFNDKISDKSIAKYKTYRDDRVGKALNEDPAYQQQMMVANQKLVDETSKIKQVDILTHIQDTIANCSDLLKEAKLNEIQIRSIQDMRWVQQTLLEAIKLNADVVLKAQQFQKVEEDPSLLKPNVTINGTTKNVLKDILMEVMKNDGGYQLIDRLRTGVGGNDTGRVYGDPIDDRSSIMGGISQGIEG